jgi:monoamine oxidase
MARTRLFARLRELALRATSEAEQRGADIARREFMEKVLIGLGAAAVGSGAGCEDDEDEKPKTRIAIIGAGMAGVACAHVLESAYANDRKPRLECALYEASDRVGGRMFTARDMFPEGQNGELGGEFIDTGHVTMRMLAGELRLTLDDRHVAAGDGITTDVWWVDGTPVPESTIVKQFEAIAPLLNQLLMQADDENDDSVFVALDKTSMKDWLDENLTAQPELRSVLENSYRGEYGLEIDEQSVLNLVYLIGSDDPRPFRIFGVSDERYHTHEGNEAVVKGLFGKLQISEFRPGARLIRATRAGAAYTLTFAAKDGEFEATADHVVFALPFTLLREVDLEGLGLSADKRKVIAELGYGTNAKVMGSFTSRVWLEQHHASGSVTADEPFQQCWDSSLGQNGASGLLTNFLGGDQGLACGEGSAEAWYTGVMVAGAEKVFPGSEAAYVAGSAVRMHWPTQPHQKGSYACYKPGQWAFYGTEGLPEGDDTLHFCGEHTSLEFQGYMEGAAETGFLVANAILEKLGKAPAQEHEALLALKRAVPQPAFGERVRFVHRRKRLADTARALRKLATDVGF